jgi:cytochrome c oxidase subunit 2
MKVHTYEKAFLAVGIGVLVLCASALAYATFGMGMHLPGRVAEVDPVTVRRTPPFDHPGVRQTGPNAYEAVIVAQIWLFTPSEIRVPRNAAVTFLVTSADVIHGFHIDQTRVNMMAIPGQVSKTTHTFTQPGEYLLVCHEYCGVGHHTMSGKVIVE